MKHNLKKKLIAAVLMAAMAITGAGTASAGKLTVSHNLYAVEAFCPKTTINLGDIIYTMGITRLPDQAFEIRYELPAGVKFVAPLPDPVCDAPPAVITLKTGGVGFNYAGYDVSPSFGNIPVGSTITWNPTIENVSLPFAAGNMLILTVTLRDHIDTHTIDNTPVNGIIATGAYAADFWNSATGTVGVMTDTTTIDGGYLVPLAGFVVQNDDTALIAAATVQIKNTMPGVKDPKEPANDYVLTANDKVTVTIEDPTSFLGLSKNGLWWDLNGNSSADNGEIFTVSKDKATLTLPGDNDGFGNDHKLYYKVDGTTILTERILKISGKVSYCGATKEHNLTGNAVWWTWECPRGLVLQAPFVQIPPGWHGRYVLTNDCNIDASYKVHYLSEAGVGMVATPNSPADRGTIAHNSTLVINAQDFVTVNAGASPRGTAIFTIDAPSACVQGLYQVVNVTGGAVSNHVMVRPGTN